MDLWDVARLTDGLLVLTNTELDCKRTGAPQKLLCQRALFRLAELARPRAAEADYAPLGGRPTVCSIIRRVCRYVPVGLPAVRAAAQTMKDIIELIERCVVQNQDPLPPRKRISTERPSALPRSLSKARVSASFTGAWCRACRAHRIDELLGLADVESGDRSRAARQALRVVGRKQRPGVTRREQSFADQLLDRSGAPASASYWRRGRGSADCLRQVLLGMRVFVQQPDDSPRLRPTARS